MSLHKEPNVQKSKAQTINKYSLFFVLRDHVRSLYDKIKLLTLKLQEKNWDGPMNRQIHVKLNVVSIIKNIGRRAKRK
jgi:hypothetical protein